MSDPSPLPPGEPWPEELRVQNNGGLFKVTFDDGVVGDLTENHGVTWTPASNVTNEGRLIIPAGHDPLDLIEITATLPASAM